MEMMKMIELGDEVKDTVTGFKGTVVALHHYLFGCTRVSVQPLAEKDFKEAVAFDLPSLVLVKKKKVAKGDNTTGGPAKYSDTRRY